MQFKSTREESQNRFNDISFCLSAYGIISAIFVFVIMKNQVGLETQESLILASGGIAIFILSLIIYKTKSNIAVGILVAYLLFSTFSNIIKGTNLSLIGLAIPAIIIYCSIRLFIHIKNINNTDIDTYTATIILQNEIEWNDLKEKLKKAYKEDGFTDIKQDSDQFFTIKKDEMQFIKISKNKLNCDILIVSNKMPTLK